MILDQLDTLLKQRGDDVMAWLEEAYQRTPPNFYSSVDLRHSGHKIAPVDTNLFPAGFNHLSEAARLRAVTHVQRFINDAPKDIHRVLIIPENHTRNLGYLDNLYALQSLLTEAGLEVQIGRLEKPEEAADDSSLILETSSGKQLIQHYVQKNGNYLETADGFRADMILVNNDLSSGSPAELKGLKQCVAPGVGFGWYRRKKSIHFDSYAQVARQFAETFNLDPWRINALHHKCGSVDFGAKKGMECVQIGVEKILTQLKEKYAQYDIREEPYVYIKADSGTYGMGIMTAHSAEEVSEINKKIRKKMNVIKEGVHSTQVIIQEGVPTIDKVNDFPAEPMIYCVNGYAVGGALRYNQERDSQGNLNARGMGFAGMCDEGERSDDHIRISHCNFGAYSLLAGLATLAAAREEYGEGYVI